VYQDVTHCCPYFNRLMFWWRRFHNLDLLFGSKSWP